MFKTHEKSRFCILNSEQMKKTDETIVQIGDNKIHSNTAGLACFLCEVVSKEDYDRTTAEGRAAAAEKELTEETEAHALEMEGAQAKIDALEECLENEKDAREGLRKSIRRLQEENSVLYNALVECRRIFGELPREIECLIAKDIKGANNEL